MTLAETIADTGLRMAVLGALLERELVDEAVLETAAKPAVEAIQATDEYWFEEEGERRLDVDEYREALLSKIMAALGNIEVDDDWLAELDSLDFDGGNEIYMWIEGNGAELLGLEDWELDTGGESELYTVESFDGIEALSGLESLSLDAYGYANHVRDGAPLLSLMKLSAIDLAGGELSDGEVLTKLPALKTLHGAQGLEIGIRETLRSEGVDVS